MSWAIRWAISSDRFCRTTGESTLDMAAGARGEAIRSSHHMTCGLRVTHRVLRCQDNMRRARMLAPRIIRLAFTVADEASAPAIAALRIETAKDLTARFGRGHWSGEASERGVVAGMRESQVWIARKGKDVVATF